MPSILQPFQADLHAELLRDESRKSGSASSVSYPRGENEVAEALRECASAGTPVTVQGARTGIAAGAVPGGGHVMNLGKMNRVLGIRRLGAGFGVVVQPGLVLSDLRRMLSSGEFDTIGWSAEALDALAAMKAAGPQFLPPDPTETSASIGGMVACNASGARSFKYGSIRRYVESLRLVLSSGEAISPRRGVDRARGKAFTVKTTSGTVLSGTLPSYTAPPVKNAAGYFASSDMDLVDLVIGSEGTLGVVTEVCLRLLPTPASVWGIVSFLSDEARALRFVRALRGETVEDVAGVSARPVAIELFNHDAIKLLRSMREQHAAFSELPAIDKDAHTAVYVEYDGADDDSVSEYVMEASAAAVALGGSEERTWVAGDEKEMERLKAFRHAVPEAVNLLIDGRRRTEPSITKLGTDMSVPDARLDEVMAMYRMDLSKVGAESVIFGHIGDNHVHVNILPRSAAEYAWGKGLYLAWAKQVVAWGGSVSAEHGIGKLKTEFLRLMYGDEGVRQMRAVKAVFDPSGTLGQGTLFGQGS